MPRLISALRFLMIMPCLLTGVFCCCNCIFELCDGSNIMAFVWFLALVLLARCAASLLFEYPLIRRKPNGT